MKLISFLIWGLENQLPNFPSSSGVFFRESWVPVRGAWNPRAPASAALCAPSSPPPLSSACPAPSHPALPYMPRRPRATPAGAQTQGDRALFKSGTHFGYLDKSRIVHCSFWHTGSYWVVWLWTSLFLRLWSRLLVFSQWRSPLQALDSSHPVPKKGSGVPDLPRWGWTSWLGQGTEGAESGRLCC